MNHLFYFESLFVDITTWKKTCFFGVFVSFTNEIEDTKNRQKKTNFSVLQKRIGGGCRGKPPPLFVIQKMKRLAMKICLSAGS